MDKSISSTQVTTSRNGPLLVESVQAEAEEAMLSH